MALCSGNVGVQGTWYGVLMKVLGDMVQCSDA